MFVVLGVFGGRLLVFWELVELIFVAWEALSGFEGSRAPPSLEVFLVFLVPSWEAFVCHFGVMLQLSGDIFGMPISC